MKKQTLRAIEMDEAISAVQSVDVERVALSKRLKPGTRKKLGQFMTPSNIATFMASMFAHEHPSVRLLDAGAGMGSLLAAYVDRACAINSSERHISATAIELDPVLARRAQATLTECEAQCHQSGLQFSGKLIEQDFIRYAAQLGRNGSKFDERLLPQFDAIILNPPYTKVRTRSQHSRLLRQMGIAATNLYSAFVSIALKTLRPGGELVAIVPRSFCNGPYFTQFRQTLLSQLSLRRIHIYESRSQAFGDDGVLQENVIVYAVKDSQRPQTIRITTTRSQDEGHAPNREMPYTRVVRPHDINSFIHLPTSDEDHALADFVLRQPCSLTSLGLTVSTGRVVDFRARSHLRTRSSSASVPLIYAGNFNNGFVAWPRRSKKANAIHAALATRQLMVPNEIYVLTKRFTSKEERRRVVACVYEPGRLSGTFSVVGFENHLNYFHADGRGLTPDLARGLAAYLNSTAVDRYFRQFSGHTQVNATDLRSLRYPSIAELERMGATIGDRVADQAAVDAAAFGLSVS